MTEPRGSVGYHQVYQHMYYGVPEGRERGGAKEYLKKYRPTTSQI